MSVMLFVSRYLGIANFVCVAGPFRGHHISVRYLNRQWHIDARIRGDFKHLNDSQFNDQVLGAIGIVHSAGRPVPASIVCEINANLAFDRHPPTNVVDDLTTGRQSHNGAWRSINILEQDKLFPVSDDVDEVEMLESIPASYFRLNPQLSLR